MDTTLVYRRFPPFVRWCDAGEKCVVRIFRLDARIYYPPQKLEVVTKLFGAAPGPTYFPSVVHPIRQTDQTDSAYQRPQVKAELAIYRHKKKGRGACDWLFLLSRGIRRSYLVCVAIYWPQPGCSHSDLLVTIRSQGYGDRYLILLLTIYKDTRNTGVMQRELNIG